MENARDISAIQLGLLEHVHDLPPAVRELVIDLPRAAKVQRELHTKEIEALRHGKAMADQEIERLKAELQAKHADAKQLVCSREDGKQADATLKAEVAALGAELKRLKQVPSAPSTKEDEKFQDEKVQNEEIKDEKAKHDKVKNHANVVKPKPEPMKPPPDPRLKPPIVRDGKAEGSNTKPAVAPASSIPGSNLRPRIAQRRVQYPAPLSKPTQVSKRQDKPDSSKPATTAPPPGLQPRAMRADASPQTPASIPIRKRERENEEPDLLSGLEDALNVSS